MDICVPLSRKEWLLLKDEYLILQKRSMKSLKKCINKIDHKEHTSGAQTMETDNDPQDGNSEFCLFFWYVLALKCYFPKPF